MSIAGPAHKITDTTRPENARLGVETTTKYDRKARSAIDRRYRSSWHQRHKARRDVRTLETCQQGGPETGAAQQSPRLKSEIPWRVTRHLERMQNSVAAIYWLF